MVDSLEPWSINQSGGQALIPVATVVIAHWLILIHSFTLCRWRTAMSFYLRFRPARFRPARFMSSSKHCDSRCGFLDKVLSDRRVSCDIENKIWFRSEIININEMNIKNDDVKYRTDNSTG
jgi:hypothetical protein